MDTNVDEVLKTLTLEEKVSLLAGKDFWETVPIKEKGVPSVKVLYPLRLLRLSISDVTRYLMDRTVLVERPLLVELEQHAFLLPAVQPQHGTLKSSDRLAMHSLKRHSQRVPDACTLESYRVVQS